MNIRIKKDKSLAILLSVVLCLSLVVAVALPATPVEAACSGVTITHPTAANMTYIKNGGTVTVSYTLAGSGEDSTVQIYVKDASGYVGQSTYSKAADGTTYTDGDVTVPVASEGYYDVYINVDAGTATDTSANSVVVDNTGPTVTLSYPNGGECFAGGAIINVIWTDNDNYSTTLGYHLYISTDGGASYDEFAPPVSGTAAKCSHSVAVTLPNVDKYQLCKVKATVTDDATNSTSPVSASTFTIDKTNPTVTLISPAGGETWDAGSTHNITWSAVDTDNPGTLDYLIEYTLDSTAGPPAVWQTEDTQTGQTPGAKTYPWTVADAHSTHCQVQVTATDCAGKTHTGTSPDFTIDDTTDPTCTVTAPNGGESWAKGSTQTIAWTANDNVAGNNMTYKLQYCTDYDGTNWKTITTLNGGQPQGSRTYTWTDVDNIAPLLEDTSAICRVKVIATDAGGNTAEDMSNANFTITVDDTPPTGSITSPTSSTSWQAGSCQTIEWTANDDGSDPLTITLEFNDGGGYDTIAVLEGQAQGTGSFSWIVPGGAAVGTDNIVKITATDSANNDCLVPDSSDQFAITANAGLQSENIPLVEGLNLVSLPLIPQCWNYAAEAYAYETKSVLGSILDDVVTVCYYDAATEVWLLYDPEHPDVGLLTTMEDGNAYMIEVSATHTLEVWGKPTTFAGGGARYDYVEGYNMVGYRETDATTGVPFLDDYLNLCTATYSMVYKMHTPTTYYQYDPVTTASEDEPGLGYWVLFNEDGKLYAPMN